MPLLAALALAIGCPQPPTTVPPAPTPGPTPDEPFTFAGFVRDYSGEPVAGAELAVGEQVELTDLEGWAFFELEDGPPVQADFHEGPGRVESELTCADQESFWAPSGSSGTWEYGTFEVTVEGLVDPAGFGMALVYRYAEPYDWVSWYRVSGAWLAEEEPGTWTTSLRISPTEEWEIVASEVRSDGTAGFGHVVGGHGLGVDETIQVTVVLEDTDGGTQPWDGVLDTAATRLVIEERLEVMGEGVYLPVLTAEPDGLARDLPVLDGDLGVLEYNVQLLFDGPDCDYQDLDLSLPPLFPPDTLTLPDPPEAPVIGFEGSAEQPEVTWTGAGDGSTYVYADVWNAAGEVHVSDWFVYVRPGCGDRLTWPVFLEPVKESEVLSASISTYGDGWSGYCSATR